MEEALENFLRLPPFFQGLAHKLFEASRASEFFWVARPSATRDFGYLTKKREKHKNAYLGG